MIKNILIGFLLIVSTALSAQQDNWILDNSFNGLNWTNFIEKAENDFGIKIYFDDRDIENSVLSDISGNPRLIAYLQQHFSEQGIKVTLDKNNNIFLYKGKEIETTLSENVYQKPTSSTDITEITETNKQDAGNSEFIKSTKEHLATTITIGNKKAGLKIKKATIKGHLLDANDHSPIFGATIFVQELGIGTASDANGAYNLKLNKGKYTLLISEINHNDQKVSVKILSNGQQDFLLESTAVMLEGVVVTADTDDKVKSTKMGFERLQTKSISEIPLVMGERDILKVASLLPGIQSVGEGSGGFNVRGSPVDQNLFYIDGIPIYNTSHFFGFFSVFNSEAISEFSLYKGNIPSKFGGRLASIFDITAREGDKEQFKIRGGISPITGRVMLEGPIKKGKSSYMIGLRSTYSDWVLKLIEKPDFKRSSAAFADVIAKFSFHLNQKNKIQALGYYSFDKINFAEKSIYDIQNEGASLTWNHFFNPKNSANLSLVHSKYVLNSENNELITEAYKQDNTLRHTEAKLNFTFRPNHQHQIDFGANTILYQIDRGQFLPASEASLITGKDLGEEKGLESGVFLTEEWKPNANLTVTAGLRYNLYSYLGPQSVFEYEQGQEKEPNSISDTLYFENNEPIKTYSGLDYRIAAKYAFNTNISIKASYNRLHQFIFLLSNTIALAPTDNWKLTDYNIKPMQGDQLSFGIYTKLLYGKLELSAETYYKKANNLVQFKDGADLLANDTPEWNVLQGDLDIYGIELMLKKPKGRFSGWLNYTYSNASVLVDSPISGEQINFGKSYPANHDKPHSINAVANYKFLRRLSLSANFVYSTGKPITYPTTIYYQNGIQLINFTERNAYRVPDYIRMDLSLKIEGNLKAKKAMHGTWVFSIYNLAGRHNVYNAYFNATRHQIKGYKVSIFARPIFSVSYNFKFGNYEY